MREAKAQLENTIDTILQVGQIVAGKYRVDHLAGKGGMAAVWAGTNERTGKRVALKVILQSMSTTADAQHLFHSEALAASRVNHPNVVTVFDVIDHEGMTCIVMEFLDGESLGTYIDRKGFLSVTEATALLLPAMRGVAAAHAQDVIHRDLKPQNIFICIGPDGRVVTSKVLDFGISVMLERVIGAAAGPGPGVHMGTPAYMSPEHLSGDARIDERTDVYGFGLLLYEALTGQVPFPGEPGPELYKRVLTELPAPVTKFRPDLPPGLVRIIDVAIAKEPDHRYSDLNLMVTALEDELLSNPALPHLITPISGVPAQAFRDALGGQSVVQAILRKEPSGLFKETKILFNFPLEKQNVGAEKQNVGSNGGQAGAASGDLAKGRASAPRIGRETVLVRLGVGRALLRIRSLPDLRNWLHADLWPWLSFLVHRRRVLVGAGVAVALVLTLWIVVRGPGREPAAGPGPDPKLSDSVHASNHPSVPPSVVPIGTLDPSPSAPAPGASVPLPSPPARVAEPDQAKSSPQRPHGHGLAKPEARARTSRDRASAKPGKPRAGSLSEDDF